MCVLARSYKSCKIFGKITRSCQEFFAGLYLIKALFVVPVLNCTEEGGVVRHIAVFIVCSFGQQQLHSLTENRTKSFLLQIEKEILFSSSLNKLITDLIKVLLCFNWKYTTFLLVFLVLQLA